MVISDINVKGGERVAATNPSHISFVQADVTSVPDWDNLVSGTISKYGRLDILVNNAGTSYKNKPTLEVTEKEFDMVMNVNVKSVFLGTSAVVKKLLEQKQGGSIINIASVGATRPRPGLVWYNASKGAVANVRCLQPDTISHRAPIARFANDACVSCAGDERSRSRIRAPQDPRQQHLSPPFRDRSLRAIHRGAAYAGERAEVLIGGADG